ncbi:hypothetical protein [Bosea sp. (in: a-proteobacteria)]|uniref:hypothetical protein n=1 Tax=Bosea sp. (in: a-proteobacteria) TaxID=1871050 RepID=UPI00403443CA
MNDTEKGRNPKLFMLEVHRWAKAANLPLCDAVLMHVAEPIKEAMYAVLEQVGVESDQMPNAETQALFEELVGVNTVQVTHDATRRLINKECVQGEQSVAQYNVVFRLLAQKVPSLPPLALCELYVQGLNHDMRRECAVMTNGQPWTDLNDLMLFAVGRQKSKQAGQLTNAPGLVAVARAVRGRGRAKSGGVDDRSQIQVMRKHVARNIHAVYGTSLGTAGRGAGPSSGHRGGRGGGRHGSSGRDHNGNGKRPAGHQGGRDAKGPVKCYNCNGLGHIARDCPSPPQQGGAGGSGGAGAGGSGVRANA